MNTATFKRRGGQGVVRPQEWGPGWVREAGGLEPPAFATNSKRIFISESWLGTIPSLSKLFLNLNQSKKIFRSTLRL